MSFIETKPRYEILDGLRGVAALCVVFYHLMECYPTEVAGTIMNHGYMAVDFFFALSGFVLGYAYDDRWDRMSLTDFAKRRLTRLHPMVIMGVLFGVCMFYYSGGGDWFTLVDNAPWWLLLVEALLLICMIPLPASMDIRGWGELNSIDGPIWTLMFEYAANLLYALFFRFLPRWGLVLITILCAVCTADITLHLNIWGNLTDESCFYTVKGGYFLTPEHLYIGYTRLLYPFLIGLLLVRSRKMISVKNGFLWTSLIVLGMLQMPLLGDTQNIIDGAYQLLCVLFVFPLILAMGAGSKLQGRRVTRICIFLGEISFPLYITHYPLMYMHSAWVQTHYDLSTGTHIVCAIGTILMSIGLAYACLRLYDEPVRAWLKEHWLKK